jgi:hypothetical protein
MEISRDYPFTDELAGGLERTPSIRRSRADALAAADVETWIWAAAEHTPHPTAAEDEIVGAARGGGHEQGPSLH